MTDTPTSDELIAQARESFTRSTPPPTSTPAQDTDGDDARDEPIDAPPVPAGRVSAGAPAPGDEHREGRIIDSLSRRASQPVERSPVATPQTPPTDPFSDTALEPAAEWSPATRTAAGSGSGFARLWAKRGWLVGAVLIGVFLFNFFDDTKAVEALGPGDCFDDPGVETVYEVDGIGCDGPHDYEVFATVDVGSSGDTYPGDEALFVTAWDRCLSHFEPYVGTSYEDSVYYFDSMVPTPDGWSEGDREATCVLFRVDAAEENIVGTTGSARSSRR